MNKARRAVLIAIVNAAALLLALYGFELFFSPYRRLPLNGSIDGKLYTWGHLVVNNSRGFREREFRAPKAPGTTRVMVLGDSLTWGPGLAPQQRYTAVAEEILNAALAPRRFEVLNFGVSGSPTFLQAVLLRRLRLAVAPDLVVVGFCLNDPQPRSQEYSVEREAFERGAPARLARAVFGAMRAAGLPYAAKLLEDAFQRAAEKLGVIPNWQTALDRAYDPASPEWAEFLRALKALRDDCVAAKIPPPLFAVLNQGAYADRPTDYANPDANLRRFLRWYHQAEDAARAAGFRTYHHEREIAARLDAEPLAVNPLDGHPSANLNRLYGEKLAAEIIRASARSAP